MRINKYIALHFGVSRREADELIAAQRVLVDGKLPEMGDKIEDGQEVKVDGKALQAAKYVYVMLNKPTGYVCSKKSQDDTPTVYELLPKDRQNLKTVGRLDKDSSGLILLTNDGDFAHNLTHPKFVKEKQYILSLNRTLTEDDRQKIEHGIEIGDGTSKLQVSPVDDKYQVVMHEGRNRQIRRTFDALDYKVTALNRIGFGKYSLDGLGKGKFKEVEKRI